MCIKESYMIKLLINEVTYKIQMTLFCKVNVIQNI